MSRGYDRQFARALVHPLMPKVRSGFLSRFSLCPDVFLRHARGFVPRLLPDLEFRNSVVECRSGETSAKRVGAIAVEVADAGARHCPLEDPGHRGRVQGGSLHVFSAVDLAEDRPAPDAGLAQPLVKRPDRAGKFGKRRVLGLAASGYLDFPSLPLLVGLRTLKQDLSAIEAAVTEPWSNGPVEGHINRLKTLSGRCMDAQVLIVQGIKRDLHDLFGAVLRFPKATRAASCKSIPFAYHRAWHGKTLYWCAEY
jgi:hypothetical protein